jgi:photosystem II stability/assembly factor-like uncharacterized protein
MTISRARTTCTLLLLSFVFLGASCGKASDGGVFKSEDAGETWAQKVFVGQQKKKVITIGDVNVEGIFFDPYNPDVMYMASKTSGVYKSETAGDQWRQLSTGATRVRDIAIDPNNTANLFSVRSTNIIRSIDAGEHWEVVYTDPQGGIITQVAVDWFDGSHVLAATSIGTVLVSRDAGLTWKVNFQVDEPIVELIIDPTDSRVIYMLELEEDMHRSVDGGDTWESVFTDAFRDEDHKGDQPRTLAMDPSDSHGFYTTTPDGIFHSTDSGATWAPVSSLIEFGAKENGSIRNLTVVPGSSGGLFFSIGRIIHKTTDGGATWKTIENFPSGRLITALAIDADRPQVLYAGTELVEEKKGLFR